MICVCCGRNINAIGQDDVSCVSGYPLCEECAGIEDVYDRGFEDAKRSQKAGIKEEFVQ